MRLQRNNICLLFAANLTIELINIFKNLTKIKYLILHKKDECLIF